MAPNFDLPAYRASGLDTYSIKEISLIFLIYFSDKWTKIRIVNICLIGQADGDNNITARGRMLVG